MKNIKFALCVILSALILASCSVKGDVPEETKDAADTTVVTEPTEDTTAAEPVEPEYESEDIVAGEKVIGKAYYDGDDIKYKEYYDENGNVSTVRNYENGKVINIEKHREDGITRANYKDGIVIGNENLDLDGNVKSIETFEFDDDNNIVATEVKTPDGRIIARTVIEYQAGHRSAVYIYDGEDNLIQSSYYDADGKLIINDTDETDE